MGKTCFRRPLFYLPIIGQILYMVLNYCIIAFILLYMVFQP
nr:MAG TPA: ATP synthase subunit alpha [Caudoviricetes sp.]